MLYVNCTVIEYIFWCFIHKNPKDKNPNIHQRVNKQAVEWSYNRKTLNGRRTSYWYGEHGCISKLCGVKEGRHTRKNYDSHYPTLQKSKQWLPQRWPGEN